MRKKGALTAKAREFALRYPGHGDGIDVAIAVGYSKNRRSTAVTVCTLLKDPRVQQIIAQKQAAAARESGTREGRGITVTRNDIINGLHTLATSAESDSAKVNAWGKLADIFQLTPKGKQDADLFSGWSDEDLEQYRTTGKLPDRFGLSAKDDDGNDKPKD